VIMLVAGIWLALQHSISSTVDQNLRSRLTAVRHYLKQQEHEDGDSNLAQEVAEDVDAVAATSLIRIVSTTGAWIYRSRGTEPWRLTVPSRNTLPPGGRISTILVDSHSIRVLSAPSDIGVVQIGLSLTEFQDMQRLLALTVLLGSPLLLLAASGGGYWLSGRALSPVDGLVTKAQTISAQNLVDRLPSRGTGDELDRLSNTLNGMLARLESAFTKVTRFTADASHELRTPVAIMRTTAEVICANPRTPEQHEKAWDVILTQSDRMSQLIDDLLMLARADSAEHPYQRELMDAAAVVRDTSDEMQVLAEAKSLQLSVHTPPECTMFGDPDDLRRIVLILLDNAIKYTQETGQIVVTLSMGTAMEPQALVLTVGDTGIGIPQEDQVHIFDRFYRAAKDRSRETGGAGLGLTIARYLAERQGGRIQVESTPGTGSTFYVSMPFS
jgi:signal transduction histidine kinase